MSQHDHLLKKLCGNGGGTLERARDLLHIAAVKTSTGSGHDLRDLAIGLPAACALIASEQLNNTIVDHATAQGNSCLHLQAFNKCLKQVRAALDASDQPDLIKDQRKTRFGSASRASYDYLITKYKLDQKYGGRFLTWCQKAEYAFFERIKISLSRDSPKIKHAVFYWVSEVLKLGLDLTSFAQDNGGSVDKTRSIAQSIEKHCTAVRTLILEESKRPINAVAPRTSPRKLPGKRTLRELPNNDSPKRRKLSPMPQEEESALPPASTSLKGFHPPPTSPQKSPPKSLRQLPSRGSRKKIDVTNESEDVEMLPPETPSKTRRGAKTSSSKDIFPSGSSFRLPSASAFQAPNNSSERVVVELTDIVSDISEDDGENLIITSRRRFRPTFLDRKQWAAPDPRLVKLQKNVEKYKEKRLTRKGDSS